MKIHNMDGKDVFEIIVKEAEILKSEGKGKRDLRYFLK